jgi:hypothetical protein
MAYNLAMRHMLERIPRPTLSINRYMLASVAWLIVLYTATALTAGVDATPEGSTERLLFEIRHVVMHLVAFAVQARLIAHTLPLSDKWEMRNRAMGLIALVLALGIGQETLQSLYRYEVRMWASVWDLAVDAAGGAIGWWWDRHRRARAQQPLFKGVRTGL